MCGSGITSSRTGTLVRLLRIPEPKSLTPRTYTSGLEIATACMIIGLTLHRYRFTIRQNSGQPIPLLKLVLRDSVISFALITGTLLVSYPTASDHLGAGLFLAILIDTKTAGEACRIILP